MGFWTGINLPNTRPAASMTRVTHGQAKYKKATTSCKSKIGPTDFQTGPMPHHFLLNAINLTYTPDRVAHETR